MARPMTVQEKQQFSQAFPNLDVNAAVVTGEATGVYNCISWTVGVTNAWLWPGATIQSFDTFYGQYGFARTLSGSVAAWGNSETAMTHGSVSGLGHGPRWESKCGGWARIRHGRDELVSPVYGHIVAYYARRARFSRWWLELIRRLIKRVIMPAKISENARASLDEAVRAMDPDLRGTFEDLFEQWRDSWDAPEIRMQSDPAAVRRSPLFAKLSALGPGILPAVAEKLANPSNFFALQLYEALDPPPGTSIPIDPRSDLIKEGEQGRALRTAELYARRMGRASDAPEYPPEL